MVFQFFLFVHLHRVLKFIPASAGKLIQKGGGTEPVDALTTLEHVC